MKEQRRLGNGEEIGERLIIKESYIQDGHNIEVFIQDRGVQWRSFGIRLRGVCIGCHDLESVHSLLSVASCLESHIGHPEVLFGVWRTFEIWFSKGGRPKQLPKKKGKGLERGKEDGG